MSAVCEKMTYCRRGSNYAFHKRGRLQRTSCSRVFPESRRSRYAPENSDACVFAASCAARVIVFNARARALSEQAKTPRVRERSC
jgi:hypothetical protein